MESIHRSDGELCGFVRRAADAWEALTVFGAVLRRASSRPDAEQIVRDTALAALAERWLLERPGQDEEIVCIQEASPQGVTVALGYYSMPGVPTLRVARDEIDRGDVVLRLP